MSEEIKLENMLGVKKWECLSNRTRIALENAGINTVQVLEKIVSERPITSFRGIGKTRCVEIYKFLGYPAKWAQDWYSFQYPKWMSGFSTKLKNILCSYNYDTPAKLSEETEAGWMRMRGFGKDCLEELRRYFAK